MARNILTPQYGSTLQLVVEVAWGADPLGDATLWTWTDITSDVMQPIDIERGERDEASEAAPSQCTFTLKNTSGNYSQGVASPNYPNVRRSTPVRVSLVLSGVSHTRFWGYATSWTPEFDHSGRLSLVHLIAHGVLQRIAQGDPVQQSSYYRRAIQVGSPPLLAYWPCTDNEFSVVLGSGFSGFPPMAISRAVPRFSSYSGFSCSKPIAQLNGSSWHGAIPKYALPDTVIFTQFLLNTPSQGVVDGSSIIEFHHHSVWPVWKMIWHTGGGISVEVWNYWGSRLYASAVSPVNAGIGNTQLQFRLTQSGANTLWELGIINLDSYRFTSAWDIVANVTRGHMRYVHINNDEIGNTDAALGQIIVSNGDPPSFALAFLAAEGESPTARMARLAAEQGEVMESPALSWMAMGPQRPGAFLPLMQECAKAEQGILADGITQGLRYYSREARSSQGPKITLDLSQGEIYEFKPVDDDQRNVNRFTATRSGGTTVVVEKTGGSFGVDTIGLYGDSGQFNRQTYSDAIDNAYWEIHKGITFGPNDAVNYRFPDVPIHMTRLAAKASTILGTDLLDRIDVTNVAVKLPFMQNTVSLQILGYHETIGIRHWNIEYHTTPWDVSNVALFAAPTGDVGAFVGRLASEGSTLAANALAGASSLSVATPSGPLWTTAADDFPLTVDILDIPITVTAITGSSSPQTFTVTGATVTKALASGSVVSLWNPPVLGL